MEHDTFSENYTKLRAQVKEAPLEAGVYIMRNGEGQIIYVGKARVLKNRLYSYFSGLKDIKTRILLKNTGSIETIIVSNEYEALLLENTLIKQHSPKYNINLKDGKTYPVIRITAGNFPRVFRTRLIIEDGSQYFGPFPNISAVDALLDYIDKLFPLRKCRILRKRENPCMYYHIGRCAAPCCGRIGAEAYALHIERVRQLVSGETGPLIAELKRNMERAAGQLQYERAARFRNALKMLKSFAADNAVEDLDPEGRDYIAWAEEGVLTTYTVFSMRGGRMTGRELFRTRSAAEEAESLATFITSYYDPGRLPPPKIYLDAAGRDGQEALSFLPTIRQWFTDTLGTEPELIVSNEKHHRAILALARQNALDDIRRRVRERGAGPALEELAAALNLKTKPERIEGFDIAQLDGKHPVASLISFKNGIPDRKQYRHFKLKTVIGIVDDFAAMREAVSRRYNRLLREGGELPNLILIDGGIGQVNAARGVLDELGLDLDLVGLAKRNEEIWLPHTGEPLRLSKRSEALKILQFVRDETHRFATGLNQRLRSRDLSLKALESVEGIGPKRAAAALKAYASVKALSEAAVTDIAARCGISETTAGALRAAAKLALEDQEKSKKKLAASSEKRKGGIGAALAAEAAALRGSYKNSPAADGEAASAEPDYPEP